MLQLKIRASNGAILTGETDFVISGFELGLGMYVSRGSMVSFYGKGFSVIDEYDDEGNPYCYISWIDDLEHPKKVRVNDLVRVME